MLGPVEYDPITITLLVDYNRSITYMYVHDHGSLRICKLNGHNFQINLAKCPTTYFNVNSLIKIHKMSIKIVQIRAVAPTPTSQAMAGLVFTSCANLSE